MQITTNIRLNLKRPNFNTIVHAKQNDRLTRTITAQLMDGDQPWTPPPSGILTAIRFTKPDGHSGFYDTDDNGDPAVSFSGSVATIMLAEQALVCPGFVAMELNIYSADGERLTTFSFLLNVEESHIISDEEIISTDYFNVLTEQITRVIGRLDSFEGITAEATEIAYGETTYVLLTGGTGAGDPYHLAFFIAGAKSIEGVELLSTTEFVKTYRITFSDNTHFDYVVTDGFPPAVTITEITGGHRVTITDEAHPSGQTFDVMDGANGTDGEDGYSPAVTISTITGGHRVTITDKTHPSGLTFDVMDGAKGDTGNTGPQGPAGTNGTNGTDGEDGFSPTVTITNITGGHRVTITDKTHPSGQTFDVMDGTGTVSSVDNVSPDANGNVNLGAYKLPQSGIPEADLATAVQTSLKKADKAVSTVANQGLTDAEKSNARDNIGAGTFAIYTATLNTTWSGSSAPYSKAQTISGILASDNPVVDLVPSSTYSTAQEQVEDWAKIYRIVASANKLTFYATEKPTHSLPIKAICMR